MLERLRFTMASSEPIAPKISRPITKRKLHSIQERSKYRISNQAICQNMMDPLVPRTDFGEENVFQVGCAGSESIRERHWAVDMKERTSADQSAGDHLVALLVAGQLAFGDGDLPDSPVQLGDGILRAPLI